ncbi:MAG: hypothetical protein AAB354_10105 [candidate division KSB1 bacterium]
MRSVPPVLMLAACVILNFGPCTQSKDDRVQPREAPQVAAAQEILVKFKTSVSEDSANVFATGLGLQKIRDIRGLGVRVYRVPAGKTAQEIIKQLQADPQVEYAEPNMEYRIPEKQN